MTPRFRAWHKKEKKMITDNGLGIYVFFERLRARLLSHEKESNWILMQSTGLKDKNSKEIFEGDVVKLPQWHFEGRLEVVKLEDGCFYPFGIHEESCEGRETIESYSIELIGNIYENPELLEEKQ